MKQRADGRWRKQFLDRATGKYVYLYSAEKTQARAMKDLERQMIEYRTREEKGMLFEDVCDMWEAEHYPTVEYTTATRYAQYVKKIKENITKEYIKEIGLSDLSSTLLRIASYGLSGKTLKDCTSVLRMIFKFAIIKGLIPYDKNPTLYLTPPKGKSSVKRTALSANEVNAITQYKDSEIGRLMFFCLYSGLRRGEVIALKWDDIDFKNMIITVNKSIYHQVNKPIIKQPKTEAGKRQVVLLDVLYNEIIQWDKTFEYVFNHNGKCYTKSTLQKLTAKYQEQDAILKDITLHRLRHTFCTMLYEFDIPVKDAQILMGHSDIHTTQNVYTHIRESRLQKTAEQLNSRLNASLGNNKVRT